MANAQLMRATDVALTVKKLLLTSAVVVSFSAYAAYEHFAGTPDDQVVVARVNAGAPAANATTSAPAKSGQVQAPTSGARSGAGPAQPSATPTRAPAAASGTSTHVAQIGRPTATPSPVPPVRAAGTYKDGVYTGNSTNAYWGNVQVKAVIQGGKLTDVQFVDYPKDRRTSQRINDYAMPYLQSEAIQAQSAQVDIISGATLTSQAYVRSLQSALTKAKG
jgi:uncharacterized protein with FMN-binding domain